MATSFRSRVSACLAALALAFAGLPAQANPLLVADMDTGQVLEAVDAATPWYPASLTKLMTTYVVFQAIRNGRLRPDTPLVISERAVAEPPSKMGFQPGQAVSVDDALKMLMVQSANDVAFAIAEGVSGSVEGFVAEMNRTARVLGMNDTNFVNPNGLPVRPGPDLQRTSARDMATLAIALYKQFPQNASLFSLEAIKIGDRTLRNHNGLIGRYPGADGMKTGYVCSSGFNVVATVSRGNRRLVTVVLGAATPLSRSETAIDAFERGFAATRALGTVSSLPGSTLAFPVDLREEMCGKGRAKQLAALKASSPEHSWRARLMARTVVSPVVVAATAPPGGAAVAAAPSGVDEDAPAYASKTSGASPLVPGANVKAGAAPAKSLKAAKPAKPQKKAVKKNAKPTAATVKSGRMKIELDPKAARPGASASALSPMQGAIYQNAAPANGKSAF
jgi:D-alanyl-D-alanine carboxypeptidase